MRPDNVRGVSLIGAPSVWQNLALRGENIKVAVIDTGIDYTHANFGGPGTVAAYDAAHAAETAPADPLLSSARSRSASKAASTSSATAMTRTRIPRRTNPFRIRTQIRSTATVHGSHVAGTAAGSGVTAASGATFYGPYNATTDSGERLHHRPGRRPQGRPLRCSRVRL